MGEMADLFLEDVMDSEESRFLYRSGEMDDETAYELGIINELGGYDHPPMFGPYATNRTKYKICKWCGENGLVWKDIAINNGPSVWRLATSDGVVHTCKQYNGGKNG